MKGKHILQLLAFVFYFWSMSLFTSVDFRITVGVVLFVVGVSLHKLSKGE